MRKNFRRILESIDKLNPERLQTLVNRLVRNNEQLEMVLSSIPSGIVVIGDNNRITMFNNPAQRLLPFSDADPVGKIAWDVIASTDISHYVRSALEEDRGTSMRDFPVRNRARNRILSCGVLTLVDKGHIRGSILYIEDVTETRASEAQHKKVEWLASLTTMTAGVAHEIKNPLASMSIHLQLMRRRLEDNYVQHEDFHSTLEILEEEIDRLSSIVSNYLFTVRPTISNPRPADINAILTDLLQFLRFEVEKARVQVIQHLDDAIPLIPLDEGAIKQVLLNLIKNALTAMPCGGKLEFETRLESEHLSITIADTGHGIPKDIQNKIFEPYFTTHDTGSGMGLTVVYKVVKEHGGDFLLDSVPGQGTTARITIPFPQSKHKLLSGGEA